MLLNIPSFSFVLKQNLIINLKSTELTESLAYNRNYRSSSPVSVQHTEKIPWFSEKP